MTVRTLLASAAGVHQRTVRRIHESSTLFPRMTRKPRIVLRWLVGARGAQIALVGAIVFVQFLFPTVRERTVDALLPPQSFLKKMTGFLGSENNREKHRNTTRHALNTVTWVGSGGAVLLLFWLHIPVAIRRAAGRSREHEASADSLLATDPERSIAFYESAVALASEAAHEAALVEKIQEAKKAVSTLVGSATRRSTGATGRRPSVTAAGFPKARNERVAAHVITDRYRVVEELGRGANGVVYRADDVVLGRQVALKELPEGLAGDDTLAPRFKQEARVLAKLSHPHIVQVYDLVQDKGRMWMAIELVEGGDLASHLRERGHLSVSEAATLGERMARAIGFAHEHGIVHRDLKPHNVLLADELTPKITDFGLAKLSGGTVHTLEGTILGSPYYMSPEQADARPADHRSDIYSLGAVLYHMLGGRPPFEGSLAAILAQHVRKPAVRLRKAFPELDIPPKLDRLVLQMLSKAPGDRPDDMATIARQLSSFVNLGAGQPAI